MPIGRAAKTMALVNECATILRQIQPCSVRALCYQLLVRDLIPDMSTRSTKRISRLITGAREDGLIPWRWITDEHRTVEGVASWDNPEQFLDGLRYNYRRDHWQDQPSRLEVWSEKRTIRGSIKPVLDRYGVEFHVMHGFGSATVLHDAAKRSRQGERPLIVLYLGDYDPSGLHMSEVDIPERIYRYGGEMRLERIALTRKDVRSGDLPSRPVAEKRSDARYGWFQRNYGDRYWELDAFSPSALRARLDHEINRRIDHDRWDRATEIDEIEYHSIAAFLGQWPATGHSGLGPTIDEGEVR